MIQRVQTLFLLGVVIISIVLFFLPLSQKTIVNESTGTTETYTLHLDKISQSVSGESDNTLTKTFALLAVNLALLLLTAYTIFMFKNRALQIRLCTFGSLLIAVLLVLIFYYADGMGTKQVKPVYLPGIYLVAVQVLLLMLSRRFIRKDEMLVKAADRIR